MAKATREAYGEALAALAAENRKVVVLDADLAGSTKSGDVKKTAPERFFDMGIAEADMIGTAAGLAASGYIPFASSFAIFATGRAWEQIRNSVAYPHLNVKIAGSHAGISVGEDGATHQACEDIALMRVLPGMEVFVPCDAAETAAVVNYAAAHEGPCYIRLGRSKAEDVYTADNLPDLKKIHVLREGKKIAVFACGLLVQEALKAADLLKTEGIDITVVDVCAIKPADEDGIAAVLAAHETIVTCEEHSVIGGLGSLVADVASARCPRKITRIGIQDQFAESGTAAQLMEKYGLTAAAIVRTVKAL